MKKIKIILLVIFLIWATTEVVNYFEYIKAKDNFKIEISNAIEKYGSLPIYVPGPRYEPIAVQIFYKIFPRLDPVQDWTV